jgi:AcrR family transcriptional regulator
MEAVSLRQVAAEAGVSMGMVQHYFADKEEMVLFALSSMTEQLRAAGVADAEREASTLFALTDGLTVRALARHHEPAEALAILDAHLTRLRGEVGA